MLAGKETIKNVLGQIPFSAELYWLVRQRNKPLQSHFSLKHLQENLPEIAADVAEIRKNHPAGKNVFIFATLHYWIEHATLVGMALAALGHKVTLGYLPYSEWRNPINRFDLRRQNVYAKKILDLGIPYITPISFLSLRPSYKPLPENVMQSVELVTSYDTQYTLQVEDVDKESPIYQLRWERNLEAARLIYPWLVTNKPDVVIVPNGTIQELGVTYRMARVLKIPTITYEFGDQRQRIWLAHDAEVMRQETDQLWEARQHLPLNESQLEKLRSLFVSRQRAALWENFARRWQDTPAEGGDKARAALDLDQRPVVLLATNVLGDSLTLGRQVFSQSMAEWISRTVQYFAGRPDVQLIIRIHPGEVLTHGQSMEDIVHQVVPKPPEYIRLIGPDKKINTYDLIEVADLGLVYTTTVGLEMALNGLPVIVAGQTHYRNRGFTYDPDSWVSYLKTLGSILEKPHKFALTREQVDLAWRYAYRFFFEYPRPFPWHLVRVWEDYKSHSIKQVFSDDQFAEYAPTFSYLTAEPVDWRQIEE